MGRLSGDEFAVLLAEAYALGGVDARVRRRLTVTGPSLSYQLSVSIGVARCEAGDHDCHLDDLFERADRAMYREKLAKRDAGAG